MLLPPPTPFFPPPYPLPPSPLSGCVRRAGRSGGTASPAVIRDGPGSRTTKTRYGTASAAASAATEEEECDGCDSANPRCRLDDSLLRLANGILLRSIGDDGSGVATEDDDDTVAEAGGYAHLGRAFREEEDDNKDDGDEQGQRAQRSRRDAVKVRDAL